MINFEFHKFKSSIELDFTIVRNWISNCIEEEGKILGSINYDFLSDEELLNINKQYLNHDTLTDIITFNNSNDENVILADIFISIERIIENAIKHKESTSNELLRVLIHGVLHLCSYNDKTDEQKIIMRQKENYYIKKYRQDVSRETK